MTPGWWRDLAVALHGKLLARSDNARAKTWYAVKHDPWVRARIAEADVIVALDGHATLRNVSLAADRLAAMPVEGIALSIAGRGHWLPLARRLEIDVGSFALGKARADVSGAVELTQDHFALDVAANLHRLGLRISGDHHEGTLTHGGKEQSRGADLGEGGRHRPGECGGIELRQR